MSAIDDSLRLSGMSFDNGVTLSNKKISAVSYYDMGSKHRDGTFCVRLSNNINIKNSLPVLRYLKSFLYSLYNSLPVLDTISNIKSGKIHDKKLDDPETFDPDLPYKIIAWVAIFFAITQFIILPHLLVGFVDFLFELHLSNYAFNLWCGLLFSGFWIFLMIRTRFKDETPKYHGAEHMVAQAYESGLVLSLDSVKQFSPYHPRCGTALVTLLCIFVPLVFYYTDYVGFLSIVIKTINLMIIFGLSMEIFRFCNLYAPFLLLPGLWLQRITVSYPDEKHLIIALLSAVSLRMSEDPT